MDNQPPPRGLASKLRWLPTIAPAAIAVFYLTGELFRDGYLEYFHLEPSMFPMDVQATLTQAFTAWSQGGLALLGAATDTINHHWLGLIGMLALLIPAFAVGLWLQHPEHPLLKRKRVTAKQHPHSYMHELGNAAGWCFVGLYGTFTVLLGWVLLVFLLVVPFSRLGSQVAAKDAVNAFANSPEVVMQSVDGTKVSYRIIECYSDSCALFRDGQAFTAPKSSLVWVVSPALKIALESSMS